MKIEVVGKKWTKEEMDTFGGHAAGICYMQGNFDEIVGETADKTARRIAMTKENGHHSVYDHPHISLYMTGIPRVIELLLDNERKMASSVKSGRYTIHNVPEQERVVYDKWLEIFKKEINEKYDGKYPQFFRGTKIEKLAMENARYVTSCFTLTSMMHTVSYRQLNYIYNMIKSFCEQKTEGSFFEKLNPYLKEFLACLDETGCIDPLLIEGKGRKLSLFNDYQPREYFGDIYATTYQVSFACFTHLNRHRTIAYHCSVPKEMQFYVPEIIKAKKDLVKDWLADLNSLNENFPQAMLLNVSEMSTLDSFILRAYERKCTHVLLETNKNIVNLTKKYAESLKKSGHPRAEELQGFIKGSRCMWGTYKCASPCGFGEGVNETRLI